MSLNTTFPTWEEMIKHLKETDAPQCFTVNFLPESNEYEIWIGNQPYYHYEKLIELEETEKKELKKQVEALEEKLDLIGEDPEVEKNLSYARDIRSDLRYSLDNDEDYVPKQRDLLIMNWLIEQATRVKMYKYALAYIASHDNQLLSQFATSALFEAEQRFNKEGDSGVNTNTPNCNVGYKEMKNYLHNDLGITKEQMDGIIEKVIRNEVSQVVGENHEFIRMSIKEIIRTELLFAINGEEYPRVRRNIWDYTKDSKSSFSKFISDILKEEILEMFRSQFDVGIDIQQHPERNEKEDKDGR